MPGRAGKGDFSARFPIANREDSHRHAEVWGGMSRVPAVGRSNAGGSSLSGWNARRPWARRAAGSIRVSGSDGWVAGEPGQAARILENLLVNALRYSPEGGIIEIDVEEREDTVGLEVRDEGPGVPVDLRGKLFRPYAKSGSNGGQAGLGLYFCHLVIDRNSHLCARRGGDSGAAPIFPAGGGTASQLTLLLTTSHLFNIYEIRRSGTGILRHRTLP